MLFQHPPPVHNIEAGNLYTHFKKKDYVRETRKAVLSIRLRSLHVFQQAIV